MKNETQIKKFLESISENFIESKTTNSIYYTIIRNGKTYEVRFSDHSELSIRYDVEIVLTFSNILILRTNNNYYSIDYYDLSYLKSFFLLLPSIYSAVEGLRITLKNQYDIINDYKSKMDKFTKSADFQEAYNSLVKIDELKSQINNLNSKITSQNHKLNDYRGKLESLIIKLNKIKDILK